jgi:hypothetical protein
VIGWIVEEMQKTGRWSRFIVLAVILGCQLMMVLDTSIVTTALPHVQRVLGFNTA